MNWLTERKYLALLIALLLLVIVFPILRTTTDTRILFDGLLSVIFLVALLVLFTNHRIRVIAVLLGIPPLVGIWTGYALPGIPRLPLLVSFQVLAVLFFGFTIGIILRDI